MPIDLANPEIWLSLLTLTTLEIVLGVDNLVFISISVRGLPENQQASARKIGLLGAMIMRIALLFSISWIISLSEPLFSAAGIEFSWRDIILLVGGLFLLTKGTLEIHHAVEDGGQARKQGSMGKAFATVIVQIMVLDIIFSLDSVITAFGMVDQLWIMVTAIVIAILVMLWAATPLSNFIQRHPTVKMLALSFLLLIGIILIADGFHFHVPRGYLYFAIAFAILVESLNLAAARRRRRLSKNK